MALLRFVEKLNAEPAKIGAPDIDTLRSAGWSEEAVYDAITVTALFNFYNRWVDGGGVEPMSEESYRQGAARLAPGYLRE